MAEHDETPTEPDPDEEPRVRFLPFSASEFSEGWSLDWSPELRARPEERPQRRRRTRPWLRRDKR